ncbi:unnamed protein product [Rhizophagus irregularis]|nr:unnamed protein product [Rhizophagus irregularis]
MIRFILNSLLLLFFSGIVTTSKDFDVVMGNKEFEITKSLSAVYSQHVSHPSEGYHKAEFNLNTNLPSFNPDQSGVESVICKTGANGKRKITFSLKDKKAVDHINKWPEEIMLLISHKWTCFGKRSTQFFTATDRVINESKLVVTFAIEESDFPHNSEDYDLNVNWVHGNQTNNNTYHRNLEERFGGVSIDISNNIGLNILFDSNSGKSSRPDLKIISNNDMRLLCTNCFTKGDATLALRIRGKIFPPKVKEASITLNGNFLMNLDFALESSQEASINNRKISSAKDITILSIGLGPFNIPGILNVGPSIDLLAAADVNTGTSETLEFGGDFNLPNFNVQASFEGQPQFTQSGFTPIVNAHTPNAGIEASASISASLKPQLAFGISVLKGRIFKETVGFELVGTLENSFTIGTSSCESKTHPIHFESSLDGNIGFFVNNKDFPIFNFPTLLLLDKCL